MSRIFKVPRKKPESLLKSETQIKARSNKQVEAKSGFTKVVKTEFSRIIQQKPNRTELLLIEKLTEQKIEFKFREMVHSYIPSFYFPQYKKAILLYGKKYRNKEKNALRNKNLRQHGIKIYHIDPPKLFKQTDCEVKKIMNFLLGKSKRSHHKKSKTNHENLFNSELSFDQLGKQLEDEVFANYILNRIKE